MTCEVCSIDGSLTRMPDTPANRERVRVGGHRRGSAPYPQLRELRCSHRSTRATVAVVTGRADAGGGRDKGEAEQGYWTAPWTSSPHVFTPGRLWVMDRNFPGVLRIRPCSATGTHV